MASTMPRSELPSVKFSAIAKKTLNRMFALQPLADEQEGDTIDTYLPPRPSHVSPGWLRNQSYPRRDSAPRLASTKCEVPKWTGAASESNVLAPIEVEV